jgi:hypothetical protein
VIAPELLLRHGGGDVLAIVDDVVGAVVADECDLVIDARGGDDVRAARLEELDGDDPDAATR